ncbi:NUDIX hydrolase [Demequina aestuarii]|uniref:NUDIX hydrolase n=1 Tax=Demequina aestuarii TaxID=327095 RepID=UPI000783AA5B|nr:NUDIX domain-containing protein [Demequina aestuarii]
MTDAPQPPDDRSPVLESPAAGASAGDRIARRGARVLLVDDSSPDAPLVLMVRGHDPHEEGRSFWFTPGGGLEAHETMRAAAVRELAEETGWVLEEHELAGPVWRRTAIFDFASRPYVQYEEIFVGRLADAEQRQRTAEEWTEVERETIDAVQWMTAADLRNTPIEVFPAELRGGWDAFLAWEGDTIDLGEVAE